MTDEELDAIRERAERVMQDDVPALLAEINRLRTRLVDHHSTWAAHVIAEVDAAWRLRGEWTEDCPVCVPPGGGHPHPPDGVLDRLAAAERVCSWVSEHSPSAATRDILADWHRHGGGQPPTLSGIDANGDATWHVFVNWKKSSR